MDPATFDDLTRRVRRHVARRQALVIAAGGLLGAAGLMTAPATGAKKKKPKKVTLCLNGQTMTVPKKKRGSLLGQGATIGECGPVGGCSPACDACKRETCQGATCVCLAGMTRDANGICHVLPACWPAASNVQDVASCCSGQGHPAPPPPGGPGGFYCTYSTDGCQTSSDCLSGGKCLGGMCPELYLATVGQACKATIGCSGPGDCDTGRCQNGACVACGKNADCKADARCRCNQSSGVCYSNADAVFVSGGCHNCPAERAFCSPYDDKYICLPACGRTF